MDDEKLDLIRRLQGVIKKNMGDIEPSDQWLIYPGGAEDGWRGSFCKRRG